MTWCGKETGDNSTIPGMYRMDYGLQYFFYACHMTFNEEKSSRRKRRVVLLYMTIATAATRDPSNKMAQEVPLQQDARETETNIIFPIKKRRSAASQVLCHGKQGRYTLYVILVRHPLVPSPPPGPTTCTYRLRNPFFEPYRHENANLVQL